MKRSLLTSLFLFFSLAAAGCGVAALAWQGAGTPMVGQPTVWLLSETPTQAVSPAVTITPTPFQPLTSTPTDPPTSTPTLIPTLTPSPTWSYQPAGSLEAPILLYHHVGDGSGSIYNVSTGLFRRQMERLRDWGYTSISMTRLANVLIKGGKLPARPVVITFDDGNRDVYENAFPIMKDTGFSGVFYLVSMYVNVGSFVRVDELKEMMAAGWEIGNHSATHRDLTRGYSAWLVEREVVQSRLDLEEMLGVKINTFAYPYGLSSPALQEQVKDLGYLDAVGVGATWRHSLKSIYFLGRTEVRGDISLDDFAELLPWNGRR